MSFKRNIENYLNSWKLRDSRKPLIIRGARQVGKTTLIRDFAQAYQHRIILNLKSLAIDVILKTLTMFKRF
ncbi:AAA family ATPase [Pedobacter sp. NJ-S-72]